MEMILAGIEPNLLVHIEKQDDGTYVITSPELPGLLVVGKGFQRIMSVELPAAIEALRESTR